MCVFVFVFVSVRARRISSSEMSAAGRTRLVRFFSYGIPEVFGFEDTNSINLAFYDNDSLNYERLPYPMIQYFLDCTKSDEFKDNYFNNKIEKIAVFRQGKAKSRIYHAFVVIKTKKHYYSIERWTKYVSIQRSKYLQDVTHFHNDEPRELVYRETDWVEGQGTIRDVVDLMDRKKVFNDNFNFLLRNCQVLAAQIFKKFSVGSETFHKYRKHRFNLRSLNVDLDGLETSNSNDEI